jgi:ElaA protein
MIILKRTSELNAETLVKIFRERVAVFVVEQECFYQEVDDNDLDDYHLIITDDQENINAYARIIDKGDFVTFGRVLVPVAYRHKGLGQEIVLQAIKSIKKLYPHKDINIQAQSYLLKFYQSFGFKQTSKVYKIDNIPHVDMQLKLQ